VTVTVENRSGWGRMRRATYGGWQVLVGGLVTVFGAFGGRSQMMSGLWRAANGIGLVTGIVGIRFNEYRKVHGT